MTRPLRSFRAALAALFFVGSLVGATSAAGAQKGPQSGGGAATPAISPTSAYGTGTQLCVPSYSGVGYQWTRDGSNIGGETTRCHTVVSGDGGHDLATAITTAVAHVTAALQVSGTPVTGAQLNQAYTGFTVSASGGFSPVAFSLASGTFPSGITLDSSTGAVAGTPTQAGLFSSIVIRGTDAQSHTNDLAAFDLTVSNYTPLAVLQPAYTTFGTNGAALGVTDSRHYVESFWLQEAVGVNSSTPGLVEGSGNFMLGDFFSNYCSGGSTSSESCQGINHVPDNVTGTWGTFRTNSTANGATDASNKSLNIQWNNFLPALQGALHHYIFIVDAGTSPKRGIMYRDGVKQTPTSYGTDTLSTFNINFNSSTGWATASRDNATIHAMSFVWSDYLLDVGTTSPTGCSGWGGGGGATDLINSTNDACPALLARLYSAGAVDPGAGCTLPTGRSDICLRPIEWANLDSPANSGSASGTFSKYNPLSGGTDTAKFYRAPCDPGVCPTDIPYPIWWNSSHSTGISSADTGFVGEGVINNLGNPVVAGNLGLLAVATVEPSGSAHRAPSCSTNGQAWTLQYQGETDGDMSLSVFTRVADANDAATVGTAAAHSPVCTWGTGAPTTMRGNEYAIAWYGGNDGSHSLSVQSVGTAYFRAGTNVTKITPRKVTASGVVALATIRMTYSHTDVVAAPAQGSRIVQPPATGSGTWPHLSIEHLRMTNGQSAGSASLGDAATFDTDTTVSADWVAGVNILLQKTNP